MSRGLEDPSTEVVPETDAKRLPQTVRRLGWVSFFSDAATEMLYPLIPIFLTVTLGAPIYVVGIVEGVADGIATGLRAVAGIVADRFRKLRLMVIAGYGVSALSKPLLAISPHWGFFLGLRATDRIGKAFRGVPRDVMIADVTPESQRGRAFGFHRTMDTAGAVVGPLVGIVVLLLLGQENLRPVFLLALFPGLASVWLLRGLPKTEKPVNAPRWGKTPLPWRSRFGVFFAAIVLFSLGNSSDAFLLLRAKNLGLSTIQVVLAFATFSFVSALVSMPAGIRSDRGNRTRFYAFGLVAFAAVYAGFGFTNSAVAVWPLLAGYGAYMGLTDGIGRALVVDLVPESVRGKALGFTQAAMGAGALVSGVLAGFLWELISPAAPFLFGAVMAILAALLLLATQKRRRDSQDLPGLA